MIKPTVFIGVGTTGSQILKYLQERIVEEYPDSDFPLVKLIAILTNSGDLENVRGLPRSHQIAVLGVTREALKAIRENLRKPDPGSPAYRAMKSWFPEEFFHTAFDGGWVNGSSNIRAAGRLHLWHHYTAVMRTIRKAVTQCLTKEAQQGAREILNRLRADRYGGEAEDYRIAQKVSVYVLGSLCGGTCSGMVADLGYALKLDSVLANSVDAVYGVFTALASNQVAQEGMEARAANCYTAVRELNYHYYRPARDTHSLVLPDGERPVPVDTIPYDNLYILTPRTIWGRDLLDNDGNFDHDALLQMIALNLFLDVSIGTQEIKDSIRTDYRTLIASPGQPDYNGNPRAYCSFGTAAASIPRYRLAFAAACRIAMRFFEEWFRSDYKHSDVQTLTDEAIREWIRTLNPPCTDPEGRSLEDRVVQDYSVPEDVIVAAPEYLRQHMLQHPDSSGTSLLDRSCFAGPPERPNRGVYFTLAEDSYAQIIASGARNWVEEFVMLCRNRPMSYSGMVACLEALREKLLNLRSQQESIATASPINPAALERLLERIEVCRRDRVLGFFLLRRNVVDKLKRRVVAERLRQAGEAVKCLRARFKVLAIDEAIKEVDKQRQRYDETRIDSVSGKLLACYSAKTAGEEGRGILADKYRDTLNSLNHPPRSMLYLYPRGSAETQIAALVEGFARTSRLEELLLSVAGSCPDPSKLRLQFDEWVERSEAKHIAAELLNALVPSILGMMEQDNVIDQWRKQPRQQIDEMIQFAAPCAELTDDYLAPAGRHRLMPAAGTLRALVLAPVRTDQDQQAIAEGLPRFRDMTQWQFQHLSASRLGHIMVFYCEEPFFSSTYMRPMDAYERAYKHVCEHGAGVGGKFVPWSDKRFAHTGGPDLHKPDRMEYLALLLEHAERVFSLRRPAVGAGSDSPREGFFRYTGGKPYVDVQRPGGGFIRINIGNRGDYERAAEREVADDVRRAIEMELTNDLRVLGEREFEAAMQTMQKLLEDERTSKTDPSPKDEEEYRMKMEKLMAFRGYIKLLTGWAPPTQQEQDAMEKHGRIGR